MRAFVLCTLMLDSLKWPEMTQIAGTERTGAGGSTDELASGRAEGQSWLRWSASVLTWGPPAQWSQGSQPSGVEADGSKNACSW